MGKETESGGLKLFKEREVWQGDVTFQSAKRFIAANSKIPVTVKLDSCVFNGLRAVDIATALTILVEGQVLEIPLSAFNVPVR